MLEPVSFTEIPGWAVDTHGDVLVALRYSCDRVGRGRSVGSERSATRFGDRSQWESACTALVDLDPTSHSSIRAAIESRFQPYAVTDGTGSDGLFTGYYEPLLHGSRVQTGSYQTPLYKRPDDLIQADLGRFDPDLAGKSIRGWVVDGAFVPYADRAEVMAGALSGRDLELIWVDDPIDAFFLEIQGSGRVALPDGQEIQVGYAGQNGRPYYAIGRTLIERGELTRESVSLQSIRQWLRANPDEAPSVLKLNQSVVFFREIDGPGPLGAQGVPLTPGRSLAVDHRFLAYGLPVWLDVEDPLDRADRIRRLVIAQDTGGAIRGIVRGDVFWGHGDKAEQQAGVMKSRGRYWIFLPNGVDPVIAESP